MAELLPGAPVAERLTQDLKARSDALRQRGVVPTLAIIRVGRDPGGLAYEKGAASRCAKCGIDLRRIHLDDAASLPEVIRSVNDDPAIHGCLLLRPLADKAAEEAAGQLLSPDKDVDGMTPGSLAGLLTGRGGFAPCTAQACLELLDYYDAWWWASPPPCCSSAATPPLPCATPAPAISRPCPGTRTSSLPPPDGRASSRRTVSVRGRRCWTWASIPGRTEPSAAMYPRRPPPWTWP